MFNVTVVLFFFFFKQKTAYEMRISDWSSDVCSSDLLHGGDRRNLNLRGATAHVLGDLLGSAAAVVGAVIILRSGWTPIDPILSIQIGSASCRERVCQYV